MDQHVGIVTLKLEILQVHLQTIRAGSHNISAGMALVALHTGMRKSEQPNLQWVKWVLAATWHIRMNQVVIETLQSLPLMLHNPFVFYGREGQPLHNGTKHSDWQKHLKQAGIKNRCWHDLRHTFASRLVMRGLTFIPSASWWATIPRKWLNAIPILRLTSSRTR
jgi:integrase